MVTLFFALNSMIQKLRVYWLLSGAYYHNKAFEKAFEIQEQYIDLNEELQNAKKAKEFDENLDTPTKYGPGAN